MSSDDFRQISYSGEPGQGGHGKAERLVRAAVSAFCALTRPSRREAAQLDDLALPLFHALSRDTRRFVSAALSECEAAPEGLVRRLADEPVELAAPLLARSKMLTDIDLVALAGRHGAGHAHAILARPDLKPRIRRLISEASASGDAGRPAHAAAIPSQPAKGAAMPLRINQTSALRTPLAVAGENAENARRRLRAMMAPAAETATPERRRLMLSEPVDYVANYGNLRAAALSGVPALFQTALADALGIGFQRARGLFGPSGYFDLLAALRAMSLSGEQAFVLTAAAYPGHFAHAEAIRLFLDRFELLHPDAARDRVRAWKAEALADAVRANEIAGNDRGVAPTARALKAS